MNDIQQARSDASFARAQAYYDHMEPPEVRECPACYGCGKVRVASIVDADDKVRPWPLDEEIEVDCPFCEGARLVR